MAMGYPLYGLVISAKKTGATTQSSTTKTISGINLPTLTSENESAVGADLTTIAQAINALTANIYSQAQLNTRQEVRGNG